MIYKVTLNGKISAAPAPAAAAPVASAPAAAPDAPKAQAGANTVPSPLPGNINAVNFSVGQTVKAGDVVIILEAMKMENEIVAPKGGTLTKLYVQKGAVVNTGDPLFDVE